MAHGYPTDDVDPELERSTNRVMAVGLVLMVAMALAFPLYLSFEPESRASSREDNLASLADEGSVVWEFNCASCHGAEGEGVTAPALNSQQFLQGASDDQISLLVSVGIPGTQMSAFGQDHGGPLTSEQIKAVVTYLRSWEDEAPDDPEWRDRPLSGTSAADQATAQADAAADAEPDDTGSTGN